MANMELTKEQIIWLAALADKGIAADAVETQRQADTLNEQAIEAARQQMLSDLKTKQEQELSDALQKFEDQQAQPVPVDVIPTPVEVIQG